MSPNFYTNDAESFDLHKSWQKDDSYLELKKQRRDEANMEYWNRSKNNTLKNKTPKNAPKHLSSEDKKESALEWFEREERIKGPLSTLPFMPTTHEDWYNFAMEFAKRQEVWKQCKPKPMAPKPMAPKTMAPKTVPPKTAPPKTMPPKTVPSKKILLKTAPPKTVPLKTASSKTVPLKMAPSKTVPPKTAPSKTVPLKTAPPKIVPLKKAPPKTVPPKTASSKTVPPKTAPLKFFLTIPKMKPFKYRKIGKGIGEAINYIKKLMPFNKNKESGITSNVDAETLLKQSLSK